MSPRNTPMHAPFSARTRYTNRPFHGEGSVRGACTSAGEHKKKGQAQKPKKKKKPRREEKYEVKQNIKMWVIPMTGTLKGLGVTTRGGLHFYEVVRSKRGHEP